MIDRQHGCVLIECDSCGEIFDGEQYDEFASVWEAAKQEGWTASKIAGEWLHGCASCGKP